MSEKIYSFTVKTIDGKDKAMADFRGKFLLIVNTASRCGFTPQYSGLEELYKRFRHRGLEILVFPANNFMRQEPGTNKEIRNFCQSHFQITFPLFSKTRVSGKDIHPLFQYLTKESEIPEGIKWNFHKILVASQGAVVARFEPSCNPLSAQLVDALEGILPAEDTGQ